MSASISRVSGGANVWAQTSSNAASPVSASGFEGLLAALTSNAPTTDAPADADAQTDGKEHGTTHEKLQDDDATALSALQFIGQVNPATWLAEPGRAFGARAHGEHTAVAEKPVDHAGGISAQTRAASFAPPSTARDSSVKIVEARADAAHATDAHAGPAPQTAVGVLAVNAASFTKTKAQSADRRILLPLDVAERAGAPPPPSATLPAVLPPELFPPRESRVAAAPKPFGLQVALAAQRSDRDATASSPPPIGAEANVVAPTRARDSLATVLALGNADATVAPHAADAIDAAAATAFAVAPNEGRGAGQAVDVANIPGTQAFDQAAWTAALARHVGALVRGDRGETRMTLEPQGLGPIEVNVRIGDSQVDVRFSILHPVTQTLVRDALPTLERLLGESGLSLGQASVSQQHSSERERRAQTATASRCNADADAVPTVVNATSRAQTGLLDDFV